MEILCIQTHSRKVVLAGYTYPLISDKPPCGCNHLVDVGIKGQFIGRIQHTGEQIEISLGSRVNCTMCNMPYPYDGKWWLSKKLFGMIGTQDENEQYEMREKVLIEKK